MRLHDNFTRMKDYLYIPKDPAYGTPERVELLFVRDTN
jgi:hypothetical protein